MFGRVKKNMEKPLDIEIRQSRDFVKIMDFGLKSNIFKIPGSPGNRFSELTIRAEELTELADLTTIGTFWRGKSAWFVQV